MIIQNKRIIKKGLVYRKNIRLEKHKIYANVVISFICIDSCGDYLLCKVIT